MVYARITLNEYANRVLNVIKAKFDLRDKSEAINKFIDLFGDEVVEKEASDEYLKKILEIEKNHLKKYGQRKMTLQELDNICDLTS
ncbi:MAG: antitoxin [Nanoarchaeota archaeon]